MNADKCRFSVPVLLATLLFSLSAIGQAVPSEPEKVRQIVDGTAIDAVKVQNNSLNSKLMSREMPFRVILPIGYSTNKPDGPRYSVIYLLHGLTGHYDNWTDKTKLAQYEIGRAHV